MSRRWVVVGLAVVFVACAVLWLSTRPGGDMRAWRAEFFDNVDVQGQAMASTHYPAIDFAWGDGAPLTTLASDGFSARLDTCLDLRAPLRVAFHLASDDGARLIVNGTALIDNWSIHAWGTKYGNTLLPAGRHHLRIDYFEAGGAAALYLASNPPILDASHLVAPAEPFRPSDPCGPVR